MKCDRQWWNDGRAARERAADASLPTPYIVRTVPPEQLKEAGKAYEPSWWAVARASMRQQRELREQIRAEGGTIVYDDGECVIVQGRS